MRLANKEIVLGFCAVTALVLLSTSVFVGIAEYRLPWKVALSELRLFDPSIYNEEKIASTNTDIYLASWNAVDDDVRSYSVCKETDAASALSSELVLGATAPNCGKFLQKALLKTPSDGRLWLEIARNLSQNNGETSEIIRALKLSYQFAPREQWIAIIRTGFAISIWAALPDDVQQLTRNELKELLPNYSYRQGLAKIYTKKPFSRKTISLLMLDQSNEVQKQFLGALRFELRSPN